MSEPYAPTTERVRDTWTNAMSEGFASDEELADAEWDTERRDAQFDRWLTAHDAEVRVRALWDAYGAVADLRPPGFSVIFYTHARTKDGILWEAQKTVGAMAREAEKGGAS